MSKTNLFFENTQAQDVVTAGIYKDINPSLLALIKTGYLNPKPLLICSGGTSSRCAAEGHWTLTFQEKFKDIKYDIRAQEIIIEAGVKMKDLIKELFLFNRSFPIGISGITGMGYILTGGISPLSRKYGLAIDQILEIHGIWGSGEEFCLKKPDINTSKEDKLKWKALCGAAPFIAIITSLKLSTRELKPIATWETTLSSSQLAKTIEIAEEWPDSLSLYWAWGDRIKAYGVLEISKDEDHQLLKRIKSTIPKTEDFSLDIVSDINQIKKLNLTKISHSNTVIDKQYCEVIGLLGPEIKGKSNKLIKIIEKIMKSKPNSESYISAQQLGLKTKEIDKNFTSFIHRDAIWKPWITGSWNAKNENLKKESLRWMEEAWNSLEDFFPGVHLAQMHPHLSWHKKEINFAFGNWLPELQQLKSKYDPKGILPPL